MKFLTFIFLCAFFAIKSKIFVESASCQYSEKIIYIYSVMLKSYSCDISPDNPESYESVANIDGDHKDGQSDGNVKILQSSSFGKLSEFSSSFCQQFSNLEAIDLKNVTINLINDDSLENCKNLKLLVFNNNNIREIPENLLSENRDLVEIEITSNQLQSLAEGTFERQKNVKRLILNNNEIKSLPRGIFRNLKNLERLHLNNNQIKTLNRKWFEELKKLEKLTLNSNKISDLPEKIFSDLGKLQMLELNSNYLTIINEHSFGNQRNLKVVYLNFNKINAIDQRFIKNSPISVLLMEGNDCFHEKINQRYDIDEKLHECYQNFAIIPDTSTTPETITTIPYPWIAAILKTDDRYHCGGVLVSNRKVVTVASSMFNKGEKIFPRHIKVILGSHKLYDPFESGRSVEAVSRIRIHPEFNINSESNHANIAVIILDREINFKSRIKPINFMDLSHDVMSVTNMFHASYGNRESLNARLMSPLKEITSSILENQDCPASIDDQSFCIRRDRKSVICIDDIGSGVFVSHNGEYYLRGIVSDVRGSNNGLCSNSAYSLITDISKVNEWIEEAPIEDPPELEDRFDRPVWSW